MSNNIQDFIGQLKKIDVGNLLEKAKTLRVEDFRNIKISDLSKIKDNKYEVGIHIADVSHYVRPGSKIEEEAQNRATSVYLVDRVIPMLPETLSNNLCSLRPNEEKLTFSAVFVMNKNGDIKEDNK